MTSRHRVNSIVGRLLVLQKMKSLARAILLLSLLAIGSSPVSACSCSDPSRREKFRTADYVFLGQVIEIVDSNVKDFAYAVTFTVDRQWKGSKLRQPLVNFTFDNPGWCGDLHLAKGERFLIYAYREKQELVTYTDCGPNLEAKYAGTDVKNLNRFWFRFFARVFPFG